MKKKFDLRATIRDLLIILALIAIDQVVKIVVDSNIPFGRSVPIWKGVFHITNVYNTGAAFGILSNSFWFLVIFRSVVSLAIIYFLFLYRDKWHPIMRISLTIVLAGALGNLIDQIAFKYVRDMFEFRFINFAIFNVADIYITAGCILLAVYILFFDEKKETKEQVD